MKSYSVTYNTFNEGMVNATTMLLDAARFYFEDDFVFFIDEAKEVIFAVPTSRQPVVKVMSA